VSAEHVVGSIIEDCSVQYSTVLISMLRMRKLDVPAGGRELGTSLGVCRPFVSASFVHVFCWQVLMTKRFKIVCFLTENATRHIEQKYGMHLLDLRKSHEGF
jgi:hypothetical protein